MNKLIPVALGLVAGAATLGRMIREIHRDGGLSRTTATALDGLYLCHLIEVWRQARHDPRTLPLPTGLGRVAGGSAVAAGAGIMTAGVLQFPSESQVNALDDQQLITGGIYRYSRNPQYAGWTLVLTGLALARRSPRALALAAVYPMAVSYWLPHEEAHLEDTFGSRYGDYRNRTPRWLGIRSSPMPS